MSLATKAARGAIWSILSGVGSRAIGLISTLVLTRFVPPSEYGAVSVATVVVLTASNLTGFGLFHWVIATPSASRSSIFHATFYHLVFGAVAFVAVLGYKDGWGPMFNSPNAAAYIPGLVLATAFMRVGYPAERMLVRDLRFGQLGILRGTTELLYAAVSIACAVYGFGGMAIVYGNVVQWGVFLLGCLYLSPWREWIEPAKLTWTQTKELFSFGLPMTFGDIAHRAAKTWDNLLVSRYFGEATVGRYNLAYNLADIPATHVGEHIGEVLLPSFARLDAESRAEALIRATRLLGVIIFPMAVGLSAIAHTATAAIFDPRWAQMAPMLMMLAALSVVRPLGWTIGSYQLAERQPVMVMALEVAKVFLLLGMIVLLSPKGILWACLAPGIAFTFHAVGSMLAVRVTNGVSFARLGGGVLPPLLATAPMVGAVIGTRYLLRMIGWDANFFTLALEIVAGGIAFIPSAFVIAPSTARDLLDTTKRALFNRGGDDDDDDDDDDGDDGEPEDVDKS